MPFLGKIKAKLAARKFHEGMKVVCRRNYKAPYSGHYFDRGDVAEIYGIGQPWDHEGLHIGVKCGDKESSLPAETFPKYWRAI